MTDFKVHVITPGNVHVYLTITARSMYEAEAIARAHGTVRMVTRI